MYDVDVSPLVPSHEPLHKQFTLLLLLFKLSGSYGSNVGGIMEEPKIN